MQKDEEERKMWKAKSCQEMQEDLRNLLDIYQDEEEKLKNRPKSTAGQLSNVLLHLLK